jgi:hypothetical protein
MVEKDFVTQLMKGLQSQGCYCAKWPDLARAVTKPFDICGSIKAQFSPIEAKIVKYQRKGGIKDTDTIISPAAFKGRAHQLPRLLQILWRDQGAPYVATCLAIIDPETKTVTEKRAWMIHVRWLDERDTWTVGQAAFYNWELTWIPGLGWTAPWLPKPRKDKSSV